MKLLSALLCLILVHSSAHSQELGQHEEQALRDTQQFLKNQKERQLFINKDAKAKEADGKVEALAGSGQNKEEMYGIAADVMEKIVKATQGDPQKMQQLLLEAQKDPQKFYDTYFDENSKKRVRGVAADIEKSSGRMGPPK